MASASIKARYSKLLKRLFPRGWAWNFEKGTKLSTLTDSLSTEYCRAEERALEFLEEVDPRTTFELLPDWERLLKIPDECTPDPEDLGSLFERRVRVLQKLTTGGGQDPAFYQLIAQQLGYDAEIIDIENFDSFKVGRARVGDALTNGADWAFTWLVRAPAELERFFRVGQSSVGERLVLRDNETLRCVIEKFKPAHTTVIFSFGGVI